MTHAYYILVPNGWDEDPQGHCGDSNRKWDTQVWELPHTLILQYQELGDERPTDDWEEWFMDNGAELIDVIQDCYQETSEQAAADHAIHKLGGTVLHRPGAVLMSAIALRRGTYIMNLNKKD